MPVVGDIPGFHDGFHISLLFTQLIERVLRVPLERGLRLGHEARSRCCDAYAARAVIRVHAPAVGDLFADLSNTVQILRSLSRQADHEIQLDIVPAALECDLARVQHILLADIFVDHITQALGARFAGKGQPTLARFLHALHQFRAEAVRAQRRQRQADMPRLAVVEQALGQSGQITVVARGQRGERDLLIARVFEHGLRLPQQHLLRLGTQWAVGVPRLTEPAAAWTAAEQLDHCAVKHNIGRGHNKGFRIIHGVQILDNAFIHYRGRAV